MSARNILSAILILISLGCLIPGLFSPILSISIGVDLPILGEISLHDTKQSVIGSIKTLHKNDNSLVAGLILLFSIVVPIVKAILLLSVIFFRKMNYSKKIYKFVTLIGKWSMADVFVVGVLMAFLATSSDDAIDARLHNGFYYFLAYCIISIIAYQVLQVEE